MKNSGTYQINKIMSLLQPIPLPVQNSAIEMHTLKGVIHLATVLTESYERFWNLRPEVNQLLGFTDRTPDAIVADLNADYDLASERNVKHYEMATTVNQWLTDAGHPMRVPTSMPEGYSNDGIYFSYTAPSAPVVDEYIPTPEPVQPVTEEQPVVEEQPAEEPVVAETSSTGILGKIAGWFNTSSDSGGTA